MNLSIIIPVLNEEKDILLVIDNAFVALKEFGIFGEIIVVNDGSMDSTPKLVEKKIKENSGLVRIVNHDKSKGIGASFWDGVDCARGEFVVMLPGDNENDPREILRYYFLMEQVDLVIPFIFNKETRSFFRRLLTSLYNFIIKISFSVNFNYTNGTTLYRRSILKGLEHRSNGFFFQTDILVRTVKKGYLFAEVPHRLNLRDSGSSKAIKLSSLICLVKEYLHLFKDYYFKRRQIFKKQFVTDSVTAFRRNEKIIK
ncbi:MAG: glycosyltransferase family 2 protein [Candidatus Paceibacterota bacterium]|jgi:glycosyltransferase involved in cell wall biosynthesis